MANETNKKSLSYNGDHHLGKIDYDSSTGKIFLAMLKNFSENAGASVKITSDGKVSGSIYNSGDTHSLNIDFHEDGTFDGVYEDTKNGDVKIEMRGGIVSLISGQIPVTGITVSGDHHIYKLKMGDDGKLSGSLESKGVESGAYKISIDKGVITGSITNSGDNHKTTIQVSTDGKWKASFSMGDSSSKLTISAENGSAGVTGKVGVSVSF